MKIKLLLLTTLLTASRAIAAISIADPGFNADPIASGADVLISEVNAWHRNGAVGAAQSWIRSTTIVGPSGVVEGIAKYNDGTQNGTDSRALVQIITGTILQTGTQIFTFNYLLNEIPSANNYDLKLHVEVFGIAAGSWTSGSLDLAQANTNANISPAGSYAPGPFVSLLNSTAFTETSDTNITASTWRTTTFSLNLAGGYDQIGIRFTASDGALTGTLANTTIAVDNIAIVPEPSAVLFSLAGLGLLCIRRR